MQCYTELLPPSGVTHALSVPFLSATANNLLVARTSLLQIFSVRAVSSKLETSNDNLVQQGQETNKLVLEREYPLPGTITDFCRVKVLNSKSGGEAVLLAFRDAKLSLIQWEPERHGILTVSIHYYERDDMTRSPWTSDLSTYGSIMSADPSSRCAVFHFGARNLAIIPFHQPGDDLVDEYGSDLDGGNQDGAGSGDGDGAKDKDNASYQTPYASSFVLPMTALDPSILHPISLAFLHEYREPTFGILYSQVATSKALLHERKDVVLYTVFTLDLEQRASTTLLSVTRLPSDLFKVVALSPPVGGSLLIGSNELVHVDQAGKTNAVGVNEFSRQASSFSMTDQSDLGLRLENCVVERLSEENGDLLLALSTGELALISFNLDGRSVSGISVRLMSTQPESLLASAASCSAFLGKGVIFFGSEDADSVLLASAAKKPRLQAKHTASTQGDLSDDEQSDDDVYEDDLYSSAPDTTANSRQSLTANLSALGSGTLRIQDRLHSPGPIRDIAIGRNSAAPARVHGETEGMPSGLELVTAQGSDRAGALVVMKREIDPYPISSMGTDSADFLWTVSVAQTATANKEQKYHDYVILSKQESIEREESEVFVLEDELKPFKAPEFNPNHDLTIEIGALVSKSRVIQILRNEVRSYDAGKFLCNEYLIQLKIDQIDLGLTQIYPIWDDESIDERVAVNASITDPYLAIIRDNSTLLLLQADDSGDLDEVTVAEDVTNRKWLSASLYCDKANFFALHKPRAANLPTRSVLMFLLSQDHQLYVSVSRF